MNLNINFLAYQQHLKVKKEGETSYLFDPIRKKYLVLQPEELVRQLIIQYLVRQEICPMRRIAVERQIQVHQLKKRCDILIFNENYEPHFLIECKAPQVPINEKVFEQIANYNIPLKVPYLLVSNGIATYCCKINHEQESFEFLGQLPQL